MECIYQWSALNNAFFPKNKIPNYIMSGWNLRDAIDIDDSISIEFMNQPPSGKVRGVGSDGLPAWLDAPPPSKEELVTAAETKKSQLRSLADSEIAWRQDAVDAGMATALETAELAEWKKYRVLLMRVDTAAPVWPTVPGESAS